MLHLIFSFSYDTATCPHFHVHHLWVILGLFMSIFLPLPNYFKYHEPIICCVGGPILYQHLFCSSLNWCGFKNYFVPLILFLVHSLENSSKKGFHLIIESNKTGWSLLWNFNVASVQIVLWNLFGIYATFPTKNVWYLSALKSSIEFTDFWLGYVVRSDQRLHACG